MFGCKHQWEEVARTYAPPVRGADVKGVDERTIKMFGFGFTNITQQCKLCGYKDFTEVVGRV